jgi:hypothetical protein
MSITQLMTKLQDIIASITFSSKHKKITIFSVILIIDVSYRIFFYLQNNRENEILTVSSNKLNAQTLCLVILAQILIRNIKTARLENSATLQEGELSSGNIKKYI